MLPHEYILKTQIKKDITLGYCYIIDVTHPLSSKHGKVYWHRHIASVKEGRWLTRNEEVHHKSGDRSNNDPDNLVVLSKKKSM